MPHSERRNMPIRSCLALAMLLLPAAAWAGSALPKGFVYLREVDPTIVQDIRYAGSHNFVGRPIKGYLAAECILSEPAAYALKAVQGKLAAKNLALIDRLSTPWKRFATLGKRNGRCPSRRLIATNRKP